MLERLDHHCFLLECDFNLPIPTTMMNRCVRITLFVLFLAGFAIGQESRLLDGFSAESSKKQLLYEEQLKDSISPQTIEKHLKWITSRPHRTGTDGARITAEYLLDQLKQFGFQTEIVQYDAYLPAPVSVEI